jgi:acyl-CoA thioester hydrolase
MRDDFKFFNRLRVRWAEVDMQKIVFNGNYLLYFDVAVNEYWRAFSEARPDLVDQIRGWMHNIYVAKASIDYHDSARFDDELDIGVRLAKIGRSSMRFVVEIYRGDEHLISGELIYVYKDPVANASAPVPEELRALMVAYEKTRPEGA